MENIEITINDKNYTTDDIVHYTEKQKIDEALKGIKAVLEMMDIETHQFETRVEKALKEMNTKIENQKLWNRIKKYVKRT